MIRLLLAALAVVLFCGQASPEEVFPLKVKKIKVTEKTAGVFPERELRPSFGLDLARAPKFKSEQRMIFTATMGTGQGKTITFAADEKRGTGKGYDTLIVDLTGEGDLARGKKLKGKPTQRDYPFDDTRFPAFNLPLSEGGFDFPLQARFYKQKHSANDASLYLSARCVMEGSIVLDGQELTLFLFDADCNGVFGEKSAGKKTKQGGDTLWIGPGSPSLEAACYEAIPLGKYYFHDEKYYEIDFPEGNLVRVREADVALGTIRVDNPGVVLELISDDIVLYVGNEDGQDIKVPEGKYKIGTASFRRKQRGDTWTLVGKPGTFRGELTVKPEQVIDLSIGPPLRIVITANFSGGRSKPMALLDFYIRGSAGERYRYLLQNGRRTELPEFSIRSPGNRVVQKEYGVR